MEEARATSVIPQTREGQRQRGALIYCNAVRMALTLYDITIDIGQSSSPEVMPAPEGQPLTIPVDFKVRIMMSPQHAKSFSQLLAKNVEQYENLFGEIQVLPKDHKVQ